MEHDVPYSKSIFVNCPFDRAYSPLFDAMIFAVTACGYIPRSALERGSIDEPRLERLTRALFSSRYSIHDLSRCTGEGIDNLARLNMPLELGMAMACKLLALPGRQHDWLVLVPSGHAFRRFISDLSGYDPAEHDGSTSSLVAQVVLWMSSLENDGQLPKPEHVLGGLPNFEDALRHLRAEWKPAEPPFRDVVLMASAHKPA